MISCIFSFSYFFYWSTKVSDNCPLKCLLLFLFSSNSRIHKRSKNVEEDVHNGSRLSDQDCCDEEHHCAHPACQGQHGFWKASCAKEWVRRCDRAMMLSCFRCCPPFPSAAFMRSSTHSQTAIGWLVFSLRQHLNGLSTGNHRAGVWGANSSVLRHILFSSKFLNFYSFLLIFLKKTIELCKFRVELLLKD